MYKYIMTRKDDCAVSFLIESETDKTAEIHSDPIEDSASLKEGDIFIARCERTFPGMHSAFVRGGSENGEFYLSFDDINDSFYTRKGKGDVICPGDELLVQVSREAMKGKAAAVSCRLFLRGRYVVLFSEDTGISVSKKLEAPVRNSLKQLGSRFLSKDDGHSFGLLFRSAAGEASEDDILKEAETLKEMLGKIISSAPHRSCGSRLYQNPPRYLQRVMYMNPSDLERVVTDDAELYNKLLQASEGGDIKEKLILHEDPMISLKALYSLGHRMSRALEKKIYLSSGANIVIDVTEAMTVIDVNTAKNVPLLKKKDKEEALLKTNLQAAEEIARQIRLRNLSGIIIIDFINMQETSSVLALMKTLEDLLKKDPVRTVLVDITKLGLVEITRKKTEPPLSELLTCQEQALIL